MEQVGHTGLPFMHGSFSRRDSCSLQSRALGKANVELPESWGSRAEPPTESRSGQQHREGLARDGDGSPGDVERQLRGPGSQQRERNDEADGADAGAGHEVGQHDRAGRYGYG